MGTPNREHQEYSSKMIENKDPGRHLSVVFLLYCGGSLFGVLSKVPLLIQRETSTIWVQSTNRRAYRHAYKQT